MGRPHPHNLWVPPLRRERILTLPPIEGRLHRSAGVLACGFAHRPRCVFQEVAARTPPQPAAEDGRATGQCADAPGPSFLELP
jgi:hypothetical protein